MANAKLLLCLVFVVASVGVIHGKGHGHSHSHHSSHHSSHGHGSHGSSHSSHHSSGSHGSSHGSSHSSHISHSGSGGSHSSSGHAQVQGSATRYWSSRRASIPTYYTRPQYVYITQYRNSATRYSDILRGLTMYNLGRSHSHHDYYFRDSYYESSRDRVTDRPYGNGIDDTVAVDGSNIAKCYFKLIRDGKQEQLKIPCAIVSTFTDGNRTLQDMPQRADCAALRDEPYPQTVDQYIYMQRHGIRNNFTNNYEYVAPCQNKTIDDPLAELGPKVDVSNLKCEIEIQDQTDLVKITHDVDCDDLLKYAEMPVPTEAPTRIMPERKKLKAMLDHPPWWLSLFVAA